MQQACLFWLEQTYRDSDRDSTLAQNCQIVLSSQTKSKISEKEILTEYLFLKQIHVETAKTNPVIVI